MWVYPRGSTRDIEPVPAELWASTRELQHQLTEWNPDLRARAIEELIARAGDAALPDVFTALADGDADIRQRALDAALAASLDVPLQQLHALTLDDPSPEVRLRALQALEERPDSASTIEAATHDPDANVRREAQSILTRVESGSAMNCWHGRQKGRERSRRRPALRGTSSRTHGNRVVKRRSP